MIYPDSAVAFKSLAEIIPEGELSDAFRMQRTKGIGISKPQHLPISFTRLRLEERVSHPRGRLVTIDIFGNNVEVAPDDRGRTFLDPRAHLVQQSTIHASLYSNFSLPTGLPLGR